MKQNKIQKEAKRSWPIMPIGFILMGIIAFVFEEKQAEERRLVEPIQTEAVLIEIKCSTNKRQNSSSNAQVPYLYLDYQYTTSLGNYTAHFGIYLNSQKDCEKMTALTKEKMSKKVVWYERFKHSKYAFNLEKPNTTWFTKICLFLAAFFWLFGIFWNWLWRDGNEVFKSKNTSN
jgi:hypothetical protein